MMTKTLEPTARTIMKVSLSTGCLNGVFIETVVVVVVVIVVVVVVAVSGTGVVCSVSNFVLKSVKALGKVFVESGLVLISDPLV